MRIREWLLAIKTPALDLDRRQESLVQKFAENALAENLKRIELEQLENPEPCTWTNEVPVLATSSGFEPLTTPTL